MLVLRSRFHQRATVCHNSLAATQLAWLVSARRLVLIQRRLLSLLRCSLPLLPHGLGASLWVKFLLVVLEGLHLRRGRYPRCRSESARAGLHLAFRKVWVEHKVLKPCYFVLLVHVEQAQVVLYHVRFDILFTFFSVGKRWAKAWGARSPR